MRLFSFLQGLEIDGFHDRVTVMIGVDAVGGVFIPEGLSILCDQRREVVDICDMFLGCVFLETLVERGNLCGCICNFRTPAKFLCGKHGTDHRLDFVSLCKLHHAHYVPEGEVLVVISLVKGDVISSCKDYHPGGSKVDDVAAEAEQHLGGDFAAYASSYPAFIREELRISLRPEICDGIAHEHRSGRFFCRLCQLFIIIPVTAELNEGLCRHRTLENGCTKEY